jgi:pseudaminic acid cytidylyltransferase
MSAVAIIPARGGTRRIPGKNIRLFAGKPMIAHSVIAAEESALFDRVLVSTDSAEIAAVAREWGAEAPFTRPPELSDDHTPIVPVLLHALDWLGEHCGRPDLFCCVCATAPFIRASDLRDGLELLRGTGATTVVSVTSFEYPIFRALRVEVDGRLRMYWPEHLNTRSQDLPASYHDAGQFYWARTRPFISEQKLFSDHAVPIVLPRSRVQDIDTPEDWERAEAMAAALRNRGTEASP